jgi:hypothetical protein
VFSDPFTGGIPAGGSLLGARGQLYHSKIAFASKKNRGGTLFHIQNMEYLNNLAHHILYTNPSFATLESFPTGGEILTFDNIELVVQKVKNQKIEKIKITINEKVEEQEEQENE